MMNVITLLVANLLGHGPAVAGAMKFQPNRTNSGLKSCVETCTSQVLDQSTEEFELESIVRGYSSSASWFPTGLSSFDELIQHDLANVPKITKEMVDRGWCIGPYGMNGIVNWQISAGKFFRQVHRIGDPFEHRVANGLKLLEQATANFTKMSGDVDMVLYWADLPPDLEKGRTNPDEKCQALHPFFVYQKQEQGSSSAMVFPDPAFVDWPAERGSVLAAGKDVPWAQRKSQLLFRGNDKGYREALDAQGLSSARPELFDIMKVGAGDTHGRLSREDQCQYKYLLYLPGFWGTISTRLRWLLACGSVVLVPKNDWYEFFYPLLRPFEHFVPAGNIRRTLGRDMPCIMDCLEAYPKEAERIAKNAHRFVDEKLPERVAEEYIGALFTEYSRRMSYNSSELIERDPNECSC